MKVQGWILCVCFFFYINLILLMRHYRANKQIRPDSTGRGDEFYKYYNNMFISVCALLYFSSHDIDQEVRSQDVYVLVSVARMLIRSLTILRSVSQMQGKESEHFCFIYKIVFLAYEVDCRLGRL